MQIKAELPPQHFVSQSPERGSSGLLSFSPGWGVQGAPGEQEGGPEPSVRPEHPLGMGLSQCEQAG